MNNTDLEEALYVINKAAKRLKHIRYKTGYSKSKCRTDKLFRKQESLYDLKKQIINKALLDGIANKTGIHKLKKSNGEDINFMFVRFTNRTFHIPVEPNECSAMVDLGEMVYRPYGSIDRTNNISTMKAKNILSRYLF
ncbi:YkyB family protein [Paenibacillus donghaensis]|uniref:Uncharacterized protein n=1 Tax=Paenibacillus donghaensis TaxID=414771 RepID=A0A2Z2KHY6_9BACL|nr:YkyB family protein [Paenibacillus donghaensis]ASA21809.1 hypothetical protein B9T62_14125 [Paenibacillus donghaensis]